MFVHHISYRYENGDVEEFVGFGLTPSAAQQNSVFCAKGVVRSTRGEAFAPHRAIDITALREPSRQNTHIETRAYLAALGQNLNDALLRNFCCAATSSHPA
jgi:hypothetical protein